MRVRRLLAVATAAAMVTGCSDGGGDDDGASLGDTSAPTKVTAPEVPAPSPAGTGVVVVGRTTSSFAVIECRLAPSDETESASTTLLLVTGEGTTGAGVPFQVEVQRFATSTSVETFTDTVSYSDTARILQVQRFEVAGEVTDLRDPDARGTLLHVRPDGLSAAGIAGPPGAVAGEDEGLVGLALDATC